MNKDQVEDKDALESELTILKQLVSKFYKSLNKLVLGPSQYCQTV